MGLLAGIHPALEWTIGSRISHPAVLEILSRCGGPAGIAQAGRRKLTAIPKAHAPRIGEKLVGAIMTALGEQTVTYQAPPPQTLFRRGWPTVSKRSVSNGNRLLSRWRGYLMRTLLPGPDLDDRHRCQDRRSHPARCRRRLEFQVLGASGCPRGHCPAHRSSGSSIKGEHPARTGNRQFKRAFFLAASAALSDPTSRAYDDRERAEGKKHNAALIGLARRRCDVLYAMLRNRTHYRHPETHPSPAAT